MTRCVSALWSRLQDWFPRRSRLHDRLAYMTVLRTGRLPYCTHSRLRAGFLDRDGFWEGRGDDLLCLECAQVWAATELSEYYRETACPPPFSLR